MLIVSTNYIFLHLLDNKVFETSLMHGTKHKDYSSMFLC